MWGKPAEPKRQHASPEMFRTGWFTGCYAAFLCLLTRINTAAGQSA